MARTGVAYQRVRYNLRPPRTVGTIELSGPFFQRDPGRTFGGNVRLLMDRIAEEGERDLKSRLAQVPRRHGTGDTARRIVGRTRSLSGRRWAATTVIGIPKPEAATAYSDARKSPRQEAISSYAALARIEKLAHPVRDLVRDLRKVAEANADELLKGIDR